MSENIHLMSWVSRATKERFSARARIEGMSESALLRRIVEAAIGPPSCSEESATVPVEPIPASGRLSVRLRSDDFLLLRERARCRGLPAATYVSFLVRSHLRRLAPIPERELKELKRAIAEISAVGRNLNQIARASNDGQFREPGKGDVDVLLRACVRLRDAMKQVINRNLESWENGYEEENPGPAHT